MPPHDTISVDNMDAIIMYVAERPFSDKLLKKAIYCLENI